jgi:hypothetical protein
LTYVTPSIRFIYGGGNVMSLNDSLFFEEDRAWLLFFAVKGSQKSQAELGLTRIEALIELKRKHPNLWLQLGFTEATSTGKNDD